MLPVVSRIMSLVRRSLDHSPRRLDLWPDPAEFALIEPEESPPPWQPKLGDVRRAVADFPTVTLIATQRRPPPVCAVCYHEHPAHGVAWWRYRDGVLTVRPWCFLGLRPMLTDATQHSGYVVVEFQEAA
jgi:hypothetical protein